MSFMKKVTNPAFLAQTIGNHLSEIANGNVKLQTRTVGSGLKARLVCTNCATSVDVPIEALLDEERMLIELEWAEGHEHAIPADETTHIPLTKPIETTLKLPTSTVLDESGRKLKIVN